MIFFSNEYIPEVDNATLSRIAQGCRELEFLDFTNYQQRILLDLEILRPCSKIRYLVFNGHPIRDSELRKIPSIFVNLLELRIIVCVLLRMA